MDPQTPVTFSPPTPQAEPEMPPVSPIQPTPPLNQKDGLKWAKTVIIGLSSLLVLLVAGLFLYKAFLTPKTTLVVKRDATLIRHGMFSSELNSFYPDDAIIDAGILDINMQIFEGLVQYENETRIKPLLASSWSNPDDLTWVFELNPNVKFHSGRTMTASDVKYSLELFKSKKESAIGSIYATTIDEVTAESDTKVKVKTTNPDPTLLNKLVFLYILDSQAEGEDTTVKGTGPYTLKAGVTPEAGKVVLSAFDTYHGGRPLTREIEFISYEDEELMVADLENGKLDVAGPITEESVAAVTKDKFDILDIELLNVAHFGFNHKHPTSPVTNKKFREAMYLAIDPQPFIKLRGVKGDPASQIVPESIPGYDADIKRPTKDQEKAKALLEEAGLSNATVEFTYLTPRAETFATELTKQLAEVGITVVPKLRDGDQQYNPDVEMYYINYGSDIFDASDVMAGNFQTDFYSNSQVNALLKDAGSTLDQSKRIEYLQQASKILMEDVAWLPLFTFTNQWALSKNYVFNHNLKTAGLGGYYWQVYAR